jgi:hypothetical protein
MTWLASYYIYVLTVTAPSGDSSQMGIYSSPEACEAAREEYTKRLAEGLGLSAECRQRVRTEYPGR